MNAGELYLLSYFAGVGVTVAAARFGVTMLIVLMLFAVAIVFLIAWVRTELRRDSTDGNDTSRERILMIPTYKMLHGELPDFDGCVPPAYQATFICWTSPPKVQIVLRTPVSGLPLGIKMYGEDAIAVRKLVCRLVGEAIHSENDNESGND